jgi:hypothetical protein
MGLDPFTAQIGSSVIGGIMGNKAAKTQAKAVDAQNAAAMAGFNLAKPYLSKGYSGGFDALNDALSKGAYQGDLYAGMNPEQIAAYKAQTGLGMNAITAANDIMAKTGGFASNYGDIYNMASKDALSDATKYATDPSVLNPMVDAAMRDDYRALTRGVLPANLRGASGTGNINNSRSALMDAVAIEGYNDRKADVASNLSSSLIDRYMTNNNNMINNMSNANANMANAYGSGLSMGYQGANNAANAGAAFQKDTQGYMDAAKTGFENDRDFAMNAYQKFMSGIMGGAPTSGSMPNTNTPSPMMGALSGGMMGLGFGKDLFPMNNPFAGQQPTPTPFTGFTQSGWTPYNTMSLL